MQPPSRSILSPSVTSQTGCEVHCMLIFLQRPLRISLSEVFIILFSTESDSNQWLCIVQTAPTPPLTQQQ